MQFELRLDDRCCDLPAIRSAIDAPAPSALPDIDAAGRAIGIPAAVIETERLVRQGLAGVPAARHWPVRLSSQCCGG